MYYVYVDGQVIYDGIDDRPSVVSAQLSQQENCAAYLDMEVMPTVAVEEGASTCEVRWGQSVLFSGRVTDVTEQADGRLKVSAVSDLDRLRDVLVRPHSTDGSVGDKCPSDLKGYLEWLVQQYDARAVGGHRIDVGENQCDRLTKDALSLSEASYRTVADCLESDVLSIGGHLDYRPHAGGTGTIDLWADVHEASDQLVELGENVVSIEVTRDAASLATAIVPYSGSGDSEVTLAGLDADGRALVSNSGMCLAESGDAIYDPAAVARWGYREQRVELVGCADAAALVRAAVPRLRTMLAPTVTVTCRAVDMALYHGGYEHLRVGQAVRVRAPSLGLDEYMVVQSASLDLRDPSQTSYEIGVAYDTLTGQQSSYLAELNAGLNGSLAVIKDVDGRLDSTTIIANLANAAAKDALDSAKDAATVATDYIDFVSGTGLIVGDLRYGTDGYHTVMSSTNFLVRHGGAVVASYGEDGTRLYQGGSQVAEFSSSAVELGGDGNSAIARLTADLVSLLGGSFSIEVYHGETRDVATIGSGSLVLAGYEVTLNATNSYVSGVLEAPEIHSNAIVSTYTGNGSFSVNGHSLKAIHRLTNPYQANAFVYLVEGSSELSSLVSAGWVDQGTYFYAFA